MTGEALGFLINQLLEQTGVLDVYQTSIHMKKNRPGSLLTILVREKNATDVEDFILFHSSTFGVRKSVVSRNILKRRIVTFNSVFGPAEIKLGIKNNKIIKAVPEYESVKKITMKNNITFHQAYQEIQQHCLTLIERE